MKIKPTLTILTIAILIIVSCRIGDESAVLSPIDNEKTKSLSNGAVCTHTNSSFHGITSGNNSNWYAIKFSSDSPIHVTEMYLKRTYRCENYRIEWSGAILTNRTRNRGPGSLVESLNESECFFHIKLGPFSYTYDNLERHTQEELDGSDESWRRNFTLSPDTWYLICFAGETTECTLEVYFNTTTPDMEFVTTEGTGTHILLPEDFLGNLNIKLGCNMVGVLNGRKTVRVNNTFIGIHYSMFTWPCQGFERFQYADPDGNTETFTILSLANHKIVLSDWPRELIIGKGGAWNFGLDLLMLPGKFPDGTIFEPGFGAALLYIDVKLP